MVRSEVFPSNIDLQQILAKPVEPPLEQATVGPYHDQAGAAMAPDPPAEHTSLEWKNVVRRVVTAATFAGALLLSGGRPAEAATPAMPAEAPPQGSGFDWDIATGVGLALTAVCVRFSSKGRGCHTVALKGLTFARPTSATPNSPLLKTAS